MVKRVRKPAPRASSRPGTGPVPAGSQGALERMAAALERIAPSTQASPRYDSADAFSWHPDERRLLSVAKVNRVEMSLLKGIDRVRDMLLENTDRFARGLPHKNG